MKSLIIAIVSSIIGVFISYSIIDQKYDLVDKSYEESSTSKVKVYFVVMDSTGYQIINEKEFKLE